MSELLKLWKRRVFFWILLQATCQGPSLPALFSSFYITLRNISLLPCASSSCSYIFSVILQRSWLKLHGLSQAPESEEGQTMSNWDLGLKPEERDEDILVCLHYLQLSLSGVAKRNMRLTILWASDCFLCSSVSSSLQWKYSSYSMKNLLN